MVDLSRRDAEDYGVTSPVTFRKKSKPVRWKFVSLVLVSRVLNALDFLHHEILNENPVKYQIIIN